MPSSLSRWLDRLNPWRGVGELPRGVWVLCFALVVNRVGTMVLPFMTLYLTARLGFTAEQAGRILAVYGVAAFATAPLAGVLSDRYGSVRVMKASLVATALVCFLFPLAAGGWTVAAATVGLALATEGFRPASLAALAEEAPAEKRRAAFALARLAINLGMSIGPAVGGFLAAWWFPSLFLVDGGTCLLAAAVLLLWPLRAGAAGLAAEPVPQSTAPRPMRSAIALRDRRMWVFLPGSLLLAIVFFQHAAAMPLFLVQDLGLSPSFFGLTFTLNTLLIVLFEVRLNLATAHWPYRRLLPLGAVLLGAGFGAMAVARGPVGILVTVVVWTVGEMILLPGLSAWVADIAPEERRGHYMGLYTMSFAAAFGIGPWLGTVVLQRAGGATLWTAALAVSLLSAALLTRIAEPARRLEPREAGGKDTGSPGVATG